MRSTVRNVVRGLLFDERGRILLVHWRDPLTRHEFLEPPGGGRRRDETDVDALVREIAEETGITRVEVGSFVAEIDHGFTFAGRVYDCRERYYVCSVAPGPARETRRNAVELRGIVGAEWWAVEDLAARPPGSVEPPQLQAMLAGLRKVQLPGL